MDDNNVKYNSINVQDLYERIRLVALGLGATEQASEDLAQHLVSSEQSGHPSHGILMLEAYIRQIEQQIILPGNSVGIDQRTAATAVVDGRWTFGQHSARQALNLGLSLSQDVGVSVVTLRHSTHIGRLGFYLEHAANSGSICIIQVGAAGPGVGQMAPFGATNLMPFLSTNPWGVGVPSAEGPFVFDAATTAVAEGKVHAARDRDTVLPEGAIVTKTGVLSGNPAEYYDGGTLAPLGGALAGHKGFGLSIAAAFLGGLAHSDGSAAEVRGLAPLREPDRSRDSVGGVTITTINPNVFGREDAYGAQIATVCQAIRRTGAMVPGDYERRNRAMNMSSVQIPERTLFSLDRIEESLRGT